MVDLSPGPRYPVAVGDSATDVANEDSLAERLLSELQAGRFAFIDAGASNGGSLAFCETLFELGPGLGIDRSPAKVAKARQRGCQVLCADLRLTPLPAKCVSFCSMLDVLEHLRNRQHAEDVMVRLADAARDFLFIRHPSFESIEYLRTFGLKLTWTDWAGHRNMMPIAAFGEICSAHGWDAPTIVPQGLIRDSSDPHVVPLSAPRDTRRYDPELHGPKPEVEFDQAVYKSYDVFIRLTRRFPFREFKRISKLTSKKRKAPRKVET